MCGKGKAKNCEGFITVEHTPVQDSTSVWSLDAKRVQDVGGHLELRIFKIEHDSILFPMSIKDGEFSERSYPLNHFMERKPNIGYIFCICDLLCNPESRLVVHQRIQVFWVASD